MKIKTLITVIFIGIGISFSQTVMDSITRKPPIRGNFRWIISEELYEEGAILNNIKVGEWKRFYKGKLNAKTIYKNGLALSEYLTYKDSLKMRYVLSEGLDSMTIYNYDLLEGYFTGSTKYSLDVKTFFLNYSLMTEDTVFKKTAVTQIDYNYHPWKHRDDVIEVKETTNGILNLKYYYLSGKKSTMMFEVNDKNDVITGKKKDYLKEMDKQKKFLEAEALKQKQLLEEEEKKKAGTK